MMFIFIFLTLLTIPKTSSLNDPYSQALITLKTTLTTPNSQDTLPNWVLSQTQNPSPKIQSCSWVGVKCDQDSLKIESLDLSFKNLSGSLKKNTFEIFLDLKYLNLSHNGLFGNFPDEVFKLLFLERLDISRNNFSGVFPLGVSNLVNLVELNAFSNSFSGELPLDVCDNASLRVLNFAGSYFSGAIPPSYGNCRKLEVMHLAGNFLSGSLPVEFGMLESIVHMEIGYNAYDGGVPFEFGNMSRLEYLDIADANLSGVIPKELGGLSKLNTLFLFKNRISGVIPLEIGNLLSLKSLDLSDNLLSGPIPDSFSELKNLKLLSVMYNDMNGTVPDAIAKLPNLESLLIWDNFFSGMLPQELGKHSKLKWVDVSTNDFVGVIPPDICSGGELSRLMLFSNYFSGMLSSISNCSSLVRIRLEDNLFSGDISLDFNVLNDVSYVDLSGNNLTGGIPSDIVHASNLELFSVSKNPNLGGIIPENMWSLPTLQNFSASSCNISGKFPDFQSCKSLSVIELSGNHLSGDIPESVSVCENLETLNLAENNFSGEIPVKLGTLMKLRSLNLSYNDLSGFIPVESMFRSMDSSSFVGNPNLCGLPLTTPCHHGNGISKGMNLRSRRKHTVAWVLVLCAVVVVLSCFLFGIFYYRRQKMDHHWKMLSFGGLPAVTAADVLKSFESIETVETPYSSNSVCKAVLPTGMTIIVKKIEWGTKSSNLLLDFITRIGNSRHRNLIRLLGFCYNKNLGYLLFEYLPNGEKVAFKRDWASKHRLMINIARGLSFLHNDCHPAIPHGNLKASNIVFDENMEPHLAEFAFKTISAMEKGEYKGVMENELNDDMFDFGEVVLEILTNGKCKNGGVNIHRTSKEGLLKEIYKDNEVADASSASKSVQEDIKQVFEVIIHCTANKQSERPSMEDVLKILSGLKPQKK